MLTQAPRHRAAPWARDDHCLATRGHCLETGHTWPQGTPVTGVTNVIGSHLCNMSLDYALVPLCTLAASVLRNASANWRFALR